MLARRAVAVARAPMAVALRESPFFARCMSSFPEHTIVRMPSLSPVRNACPVTPATIGSEGSGRGPWAASRGHSEQALPSWLGAWLGRLLPDAGRRRSEASSALAPSSQPSRLRACVNALAP